jgi:hypothetical protein
MELNPVVRNSTSTLPLQTCLNTENTPIERVQVIKTPTNLCLRCTNSNSDHKICKKTRKYDPCKSQQLNTNGFYDSEVDEVPDKNSKD